MAQPRIPSIDALLHDPRSYLDKVAKLPAALVSEVEQQLRVLHQQLGATSNVPATPVEMAIAHPRYRWMDTRHLRFLGEHIAEAIELRQAKMVCMPPRCVKSTTLSQWTPFWALARRPRAPHPLRLLRGELRSQVGAEDPPAHRALRPRVRVETNEDNYLFYKFFNTAIGSPNIDFLLNMEAPAFAKKLPETFQVRVIHSTGLIAESNGDIYMTGVEGNLNTDAGATVTTTSGSVTIDDPRSTPTARTAWM